MTSANHRCCLYLYSNNDNRSLISVSSSFLDPRGVFIIRAYRGHLGKDVGSDMCNVLFIWQGSMAQDRIVQSTKKLAMTFVGILVTEHVSIELVREGQETADFWEFVMKNGSVEKGVNYGCGLYDDLYVGLTEGNLEYIQYYFLDNFVSLETFLYRRYNGKGQQWYTHFYQHLSYT